MEGGEGDVPFGPTRVICWFQVTVVIARLPRVGAARGASPVEMLAALPAGELTRMVASPDPAPDKELESPSTLVVALVSAEVTPAPSRGRAPSWWSIMNSSLPSISSSSSPPSAHVAPSSSASSVRARTFRSASGPPFPPLPLRPGRRSAGWR